MLDDLLSSVGKDARERLKSADEECNCLSASVKPEDDCDTVPSDIGDIDTDDLL